MNNELKITKIPIKYEREIAFMLHNYNRIDKLIEKRKGTITENMNVTNGAYLKAVHSVHSNILEDVIDKFETDANILRLKEWRKTINVFCSKLLHFFVKKPIQCFSIQILYSIYLQSVDFCRKM